MRRTGALALLAVAPFLIAARDPRGDVTACGSGAPVTDPAADVVAVQGTAAELGTAGVWRVTFAAPVTVPDRAGSPLRIDVLVRDPKIAPVNRGDELGMNRIVRWTDTSPDATEEIMWVYERSSTSFNPPAIDGRTVTLTVPGRMLLGESANGTEFVRRARWSLLVRDGDACDRVGGVPAFRLQEEAPSPTPTLQTVSPRPSRTAAATPTAAPDRSPGWPVLVIGGLALLGFIALPRYLMRRKAS